MPKMDGAVKNDQNETNSSISTPNSSRKQPRKWDTSLLNWVNCILGPDSFVSLSCEVAYALIKYFENANGTNKSDQYSDESVIRFLKKEYPYFRYGSVTDATIRPEDVILIISLLLHYSCVKSKDITIRGNMCKTLDVTDQKAIAMFANNLVRHENITERNLLNAIKAITVENKYEESFSEISSPLQMKKDSLELSGSKTNIMSPLSQTPLRKSRKVFHLEAELGAERFDRNFLQEEVDRLHRRITELEKLEKSYLHEMQRLRVELSTIQDSNKENLAESSSCDHCKYKDKILQDELRSHEIEVLRLLSNIQNLEEQRDILNMKLNEADNAVSVWSTQAIQLENTETILKTQISEMGSKISDLELELSYTKQCLNEYSKDRNMNCSIECDDDTPIIKKKLNYSLMSSAENLGETVIDVQLKEQTSKNESLSFQLEKTVKENERLEMEFQKLKNLYSDIMEASQLLKEENEKYSFKLQYLEDLEVQYKECKMNFDTKIGVIEELNAKIETLSNTNNNLEIIIENNESNMCLLNETIEKFKYSAENLSQKCADLEMLQEQIITEKDNLQESCESKDKKIKSLTKEVVSLENFVDNYKIIIEGYKHEVVDNEVKLDNLNRNCRQLEEEVNSLSLNLRSLTDEKLELDSVICLQQNQISECNEKMHVEQEKLKAIVDDNNSMSKKLSNVEYNLRMKVQEFENCFNECTKLTEEAISLKKLIDDHEIAIGKMTNEKDVLFSENASLQDSFEQSNLELMKYKRKLSEKAAVIEKIESENLNLVNIVNDQKVEIEKSETELVVMNEKLTDILNSKCATEVKLEDIESNLSIKLMELTKVSIELEEKNSELTDLKTENSHVQNMLNDKTRKIDELNAKTETLQREKSSLQEKLESTELDICVMNASMEKLKNDAENLSQKCDDFEILQVQISDENNNLKETCENKSKEIELLTEEIESCKNLISSYEIQNKDYEREIVGKDLQLDNLNKKCLELEDKLNSLTVEFTNLNDEKVRLNNLVCLQQDQITECNEKMHIEQEKLKTIVNDNSLMVNKLSDLECNLKMKVEEFDNCSADCTKLTEETIILRKLISTHESTIEKMIDEKEVIVSENASLQASFDKTNLDLMRLKQELIEKDSKVKQIVNENVELLNVIDMKKNEIEKSQNELAAINDKLNDTSNLKCATETKLEDIERNLSTKIIELTKISIELEEKNSELTDLKTENSHILNMLKEKIRIVDEFNLNSETISKENDDLKEKIDNSKSEICVLNGSIETLNESVKNLSQKCDDLEILKVRLSDDNNNLKETCENKIKEMETLNKEISLHKKLIDNFEIQIEDYKKEINSKESELVSLNQKYQELEGKVDSLSSEITGLICEKSKLNDLVCLQQEQINECNKKVNAEQEKLKTTSDDNSRMLKKLSEVECDLKIKIQELNNCSVDYMKLIEESIALKKLIEVHENTIEKCINEKQILNSETITLCESLDKTNIELIKIKTEYIEKDADTEKLKSENLKLAELVSSQMVEIENRKTELFAMNDKLTNISNLKGETETQIKEIESNLTTKITELTEETASLKNLLHAHESTIEKCMKEKETLISETTSLHESLDKTNQELMKMKTEYIEKDTDTEKLKGENLNLADIVNSLTVEIENRKTELFAMNDKLTNVSNLKDKAETQIKEVESNLTTKITELTEETVSLQKLIEVHESTIEKCINEKEILNSETTTLRESLDKTNQELIKMKTEYIEKDTDSNKLKCENLKLTNLVSSQMVEIENRKTELFAVNDKLTNISNLKDKAETQIKEIESNLTTKISELTKEAATLKTLLESHESAIDKCMKEKEILISETISLHESYDKTNLELMKHKRELGEKAAVIEKIESENLNLVNVVNGQKIKIEKSEAELKAVKDKLIEESNSKCAKETKLKEIESILGSNKIEVDQMKVKLEEMNIEMVNLKTENSNLQNLSDNEKQKRNADAQFTISCKKIDSLLDRAMEHKNGDKSDLKIKTENRNDLVPKVRKNDSSENKENFNSDDITIRSSKMEKKLVQKLCDFISKEISKNKKSNEALSISAKYCDNSNDDAKLPPSCAHKIDLEHLVRKIMKQSSDCEKNCHSLNESLKSSKMDKSDVSFTTEDENLSFEVFDTDVLQYYSNNDKTFTRFDEFEDHLFSDDATNEYLNNSKEIEKCIPLQSQSTELIAKACAQNILMKDDLILNLKNKCKMLNNKISDLSSDNEKLKSEMETLLVLEKNDTSVINTDDYQVKLPCKYCSFKCTETCCSKHTDYSENCERSLTNDLITSTSNSDNLKIYFDVPNVKDESRTKTILTKIFHLISHVEVDLLIKSEKDITNYSSFESAKDNSSINDANFNIENQINDKELSTTESINHIHDVFEKVVNECTNLKTQLKSCENENTVFKQQFYNISQVMKHTKEEISRYETDFVAVMSSRAEINNKYTSLKEYLKKIESEMLLSFNDETVLKNTDEYHIKLSNICGNIEDDLLKLNKQIFDFSSFKKWLDYQFDNLISDFNTDEHKISYFNSYNFEVLDSIRAKLCDADVLLKEYDVYSSQIKNIKDDAIVNAGKYLSVYEQIQSISNNFKSLQNDIAYAKKQEKASEDNVCKIKEDYNVLIKANQQLSIENIGLLKNLQDKECQVSEMAADKANMQSVIESKEALSSINVRLTIENTKLKDENEMLAIKLNDVNMRMYSENVKPLIDYDNILQENIKLVDALKQTETEFTSMKSLYNQLVIEHNNLKKTGAQENVNSLITDLRNEYEDKLSRMKIKMKQLYQEQISVYLEKQKEELTRSELLCKKYADKIKSYESHVNQLSSELWKVGEKLLMERNEKDWLKQQLRERLGSRQSLQFATSTVDNGKLRTTNSVLRVFDDSVKEIINESIGKIIPKRIQAESGGLHMSDEEGEIFDNTYLADLKSGICEPRYSSKSNCDKNTDLQPNRLSELQWRNSMCLPHLKSSYPAETQFQRFKEEDIKMGAANIDDEKTSRPKKEVGQTTYKRPGPPTPSKKGGRLSLQGNDAREPLKEQNDNATKKATTPSRIRSLFMGNSSRSTQKDENTFGTPKGKRLSIFRKPR